MEQSQGGDGFHLSRIGREREDAVWCCFVFFFDKHHALPGPRASSRLGGTTPRALSRVRGPACFSLLLQSPMRAVSPFDPQRCKTCDAACMSGHTLSGTVVHAHTRGCCYCDSDHLPAEHMLRCDRCSCKKLVTRSGVGMAFRRYALPPSARQSNLAQESCRRPSADKEPRRESRSVPSARRR